MQSVHIHTHTAYIYIYTLNALRLAWPKAERSTRLRHKRSARVERSSYESSSLDAAAKQLVGKRQKRLFPARSSSLTVRHFCRLASQSSNALTVAVRSLLLLLLCSCCCCCCCSRLPLGVFSTLAATKLNSTQLATRNSLAWRPLRLAVRSLVWPSKLNSRLANSNWPSAKVYFANESNGRRASKLLHK